MIHGRTLAATVISIALASLPLRADVTFTESILTRSTGQKVDVRRVISLKGLSMRVEAVGGDERVVTIYDAAAGRIVVLNPGKKQAEVYQADKVAAEVEKKLPSRRVTTELKPTGRSKGMLGVTCEEYEFVIRAPIGATSNTMFSLTGTAWIARTGPGVEDYVTFYKAAEKQQLIFGDFNSSRAVLALTRGQTELYRRIGALGGVPYAIDFAFKFDGTGMAIGLANKMASGTRVTTTTAVQTSPIADETFAIPKGWTTKNK